MKEDYENIVRQFYIDLRPKFMRILTKKYPMLRLDEAEDLYQEAFIAVHNNIKKGRVKENTSWENYVITIGLNMASNELRTLLKTDSFDAAEETQQSRFNSVLSTITDEDSRMHELEIQAILGDELEHTPGKCRQILKLFYYKELNMEEIAEEVGLKNASSAKVTKVRCMKDLMVRVKNAVRQAGINI